MIAPKEIKIKSDGNLLVLSKINKDGSFEYQYKKSISKKNQLLTLTEENLIKLLKQNDYPI